MTKHELLAAMQRGRRQWEALLAVLNEAEMLEPVAAGSGSVRDVLAHVAGYDEYAAALVKDLSAGAAPSALEALDASFQQQLDTLRATGGALSGMPTIAARLADLSQDQTNAFFVAVGRTQTVHEVVRREQPADAALLEAVQAASEPDLLAPRAELQGRSLMQIVPNQCYGHYQMHLPEIVAWIERKQRQIETPSGAKETEE